MAHWIKVVGRGGPFTFAERPENFVRVGFSERNALTRALAPGDKWVVYINGMHVFPGVQTVATALRGGGLIEGYPLEVGLDPAQGLLVETHDGIPLADVRGWTGVSPMLAAVLRRNLQGRGGLHRITREDCERFERALRARGAVVRGVEGTG